MSDPRLTALKIAYKGELHRVRVDLAAFQYADLAELFATTFQLSPNSFVVQYTDPEGDVLNVTSQVEYQEACRVFLASAPQDVPKSLRFSAVSRTQQMLHDAVADPILKALEKLVATLTEALAKVQREEWAQRAQAGVQAGLGQTEAWMHQAHQNVSAGVQMGVERSEEWAQRAQAGVHAGLGQTSEVLTRAAKEARESLVQARQQLQEIPFDELVNKTSTHVKGAVENLQAIPFDDLLNKTGTHVKGAVENLQALAQEVVSEVSKINLSSATTTEVPAATEPDWEAVAVPEAVPAPVPEPEVIAPAPEPTPEELKWAVEISKVRDIFPDVDTQRVIENLEMAHGNVHVVLNSLMEDM